MNIFVDSLRYFRGASDALFSLGAVREATPGANYRVHLELHHRGRLGSRLEVLSDSKLAAKLYATAGIVNDIQAICFCRIGVQRDIPPELTVDFLLRELLKQMQLWVDGRELVGEILVTREVGPPTTSEPRLSFHLRVGFDGSRHYEFPRTLVVDMPRREIGPYVEIRISEPLFAIDSTDGGSAKSVSLACCANDRTALRRPRSEQAANTDRDEISLDRYPTGTRSQ